MARSNIDYSKYPQTQLAAAWMMADPDSRFKNKDIAEAIGVSERTIYRWREDQDFIDLVNDLAEKYMDTFLSEIYRQLQKAVSKGSVKAIELALKRSGKLIEKREVTSDINIEVVPLQSKSNDQLLSEIKELERKLMSLPAHDSDLIVDAEVLEPSKPPKDGEDK